MIPLNSIVEKAEAYKPKQRITYKLIKEYILEKYSFKVHAVYISKVKRRLGLPMYDAPNAVETLKNPITPHSYSSRCYQRCTNLF